MNMMLLEFCRNRMGVHIHMSQMKFIYVNQILTTNTIDQYFSIKELYYKTAMD